MESPSSTANRRRSLRTLRTNTERLAECGHDLMHIDPTSDRDLKCDVCWRNRETLIARLLEPFERALRGVGPSGEIDQAEIERLEREDREREREREEKRKVAEEARRRKEEETKRKRERMRAMQEERRGKGGKFEKKKPKSAAAPLGKKAVESEKKDMSTSFLQYNGPVGKFAVAEKNEEGEKEKEKATGSGAVQKAAVIGMVAAPAGLAAQADWKEPEGKHAVEPVVRQPAEETEDRKSEGRPKTVETTSMATDLPSRPDQLQPTISTGLPTVQSVKAWVLHGNEHFSTSDVNLPPRPPPYRLEPRRRRRSSSHTSPPPSFVALQEPGSKIRVVQPPVETRASRRRSISTSVLPPSRSVSKSSLKAQAKKTMSQPRLTSTSTTSQPPPPVHPGQKKLPEAIASKFTIARHPYAGAPSMGSGSESPTAASSSTAESSSSTVPIRPEASTATDTSNQPHQYNEFLGSEKCATGARGLASEEAWMLLDRAHGRVFSSSPPCSAGPAHGPKPHTPRALATVGSAIQGQQQQLTISSFFRPSGLMACMSPGSDSSTNTSFNTTATSSTAAAASATTATVMKQSQREQEQKRVLRERERRKIVREEDNSGRRKSTRSVASAVNYCESSDDEGQEL